MVKNLLDVGYEIIVYDVFLEVVVDLKLLGVVIVVIFSEVVFKVFIIVIMLLLRYF